MRPIFSVPSGSAVFPNRMSGFAFVRVETDEGIHGIGEGTLGQLSRTVESAILELKPFVVGFEAFQVEAIVGRLSRDIFADGAQIKMCAISAIEIACWDDCWLRGSTSYS
jgi:galactonate dehydratase